MRKMGSVPVFVLCAALGAGPAAAQASECPLTTWEPDIVARVSPTRAAVELRKKLAPPSAPAECLISLDCEVRAEPVRIEYELATLARPKSPPRFTQVRRVIFAFADGSEQSCASSGASVPLPGPNLDHTIPKINPDILSK
jgi:hypothetical protein